MEDKIMKIAKIILGVLAFACIAAAVLTFSFNHFNKETLLAIGKIPDEVIFMVCVVLAPAALAAVCVLALIEKIMSGSKGKGLMIAGMIIFGCVTAFMGSIVYGLRDDTSMIKELKSPDGQHKIYYINTQLERSYGEIPAIRTLKRTGMFTYKKQAIISDDTREFISWDDEGYHYFFNRFEYSSYGK